MLGEVFFITLTERLFYILNKIKLIVNCLILAFALVMIYLVILLCS